MKAFKTSFRKLFAPILLAAALYAWLFLSYDGFGIVVIFSIGTLVIQALSLILAFFTSMKGMIALLRIFCLTLLTSSNLFIIYLGADTYFSIQSLELAPYVYCLFAISTILIAFLLFKLRSGNIKSGYRVKPGMTTSQTDSTSKELDK